MRTGILDNLNLLIMGGIVVVLLVLAFVTKGSTGAGEGLREGGVLLWKIWPLLLLAMAAAGLLQALVPARLVSSYLGSQDPFRGICIAWGLGALLPGAPYVTLPIAAALLERGAAIGPAATVVLSATFLSVTRIPYEITFVGWQFSALRIGACALLPPVAGLAVHGLNKAFHFFPAG